MKNKTSVRIQVSHGERGRERRMQKSSLFLITKAPSELFVAFVLQFNVNLSLRLLGWDFFFVLVNLSFTSILFYFQFILFWFYLFFIIFYGTRLEFTIESFFSCLQHWESNSPALESVSKRELKVARLLSRSNSALFAVTRYPFYARRRMTADQICERRAAYTEIGAIVGTDRWNYFIHSRRRRRQAWPRESSSSTGLTARIAVVVCVCVLTRLPCTCTYARIRRRRWMNRRAYTRIHTYTTKEWYRAITV